MGSMKIKLINIQYTMVPWILWGKSISPLKSKNQPGFPLQLDKFNSKLFLNQQKAITTFRKQKQLSTQMQPN